MHGQGTFLWRTGERYDGEWKVGLEYGQGVFTFADGSVFDGFWSNGRKHGIGLYRPSTLKGCADAKAYSTKTSGLLNFKPSSPGSGDVGPKSAAETADSGSVLTPHSRRSSVDLIERANVASTETMYIREYDRGRITRNVPLVGKEVIDMLASLIGQNSDQKGRGKVRTPPLQQPCRWTDARVWNDPSGACGAAVDISTASVHGVYTCRQETWRPSNMGVRPARARGDRAVLRRRCSAGKTPKLARRFCTGTARTS